MQKRARLNSHIPIHNQEPPTKAHGLCIRWGKAAEALEGGLTHTQTGGSQSTDRSRYIPSLFTNSTPICHSQRWTRASAQSPLDTFITFMFLWTWFLSCFIVWSMSTGDKEERWLRNEIICSAEQAFSSPLWFEFVTWHDMVEEVMLHFSSRCTCLGRPNTPH